MLLTCTYSFIHSFSTVNVCVQPFIIHDYTLSRAYEEKITYKELTITITWYCHCVLCLRCSDSADHQQHQQPLVDYSLMNVDSLSDTLPRVASDDDTSLAVYADHIDFGKFQEDGSFIGQYNVHRAWSADSETSNVTVTLLTLLTCQCGSNYSLVHKTIALLLLRWFWQFGPISTSMSLLHWQEICSVERETAQCYSSYL